MKKIVFVIGSLGIGGAERVISILANYFSKNGYDVSIILFYQHNRIDYVLDKDVKIIPVVAKGNKLSRILSRVTSLRKIIRSIMPDIVISFLTEINIYMIIAMAQMSVPLVISERNDPKNDPKQKLLRILRWVTYKRSNGIVFQTEQAKDYFSHLKIKSTVIPNPITGKLPNACAYVNRQNTIVSVCRLTKQKNIPMLIEAFSRLPEAIKASFSVEIYGEGPLKEELQALVDIKGLTQSVLFKGFSKNIHEDILKSKLYVSTSDYEGISNSMLEALALGIPTICTDCPVGGARLAIQNNYNGVLVEVGDIDQLQNAMLRVLTDKSFSISISSHFMEIREKFSEKNIIMLWENFIEEILCNEQEIA